ncbi:hypothetical protein [Polymorphospora sp. NPDC050346]|uniref:hypothetical protein n=1 Tax=Polymorphospora sp. NPDC050346 TaxID=3155780 RepID=UPI0033C912C2
MPRTVAPETFTGPRSSANRRSTSTHVDPLPERVPTIRRTSSGITGRGDPPAAGIDHVAARATEVDVEGLRRRGATGERSEIHGRGDPPPAHPHRARRIHRDLRDPEIHRLEADAAGDVERRHEHARGGGGLQRDAIQGVVAVRRDRAAERGRGPVQRSEGGRAHRAQPRGHRRPQHERDAEGDVARIRPATGDEPVRSIGLRGDGDREVGGVLGRAREDGPDRDRTRDLGTGGAERPRSAGERECDVGDGGHEVGEHEVLGQAERQRS